MKEISKGMDQSISSVFWDLRVLSLGNFNAREEQFDLQSTVEQENFATGNFRDFRPQAIRMQEI